MEKPCGGGRELVCQRYGWEKKSRSITPYAALSESASVQAFFGTFVSTSITKVRALDGRRSLRRRDVAVTIRKRRLCPSIRRKKTREAAGLSIHPKKEPPKPRVFAIAGKKRA